MNRILKPESFPRLLNFGTAVLFAAVLIGFAVLSFWNGGVDFRGYYGAAVLVREGGNPYLYRELAPVLERITGYMGNNPYFYPPWYCLLFIPLTFLPFQAARMIWLLISLVLFYLASEYTYRLLELSLPDWKRWLLFTGAFLLFGAYCLRSEQAGILVFFGFALVLKSIQDRQPFWAGLGIILAVSKPQATLLPVILLLVWTVSQRPAVVKSGLVWLIFLLVVSSLAIPGWWKVDLTSFGAGINYALDGSEVVAAKRVNSTVYDFFIYQVPVPPPYRYLIISGIGLVGFALLGFGWMRYRDLMFLVGAGMLVNLLLTPYALQYDYVPLLFLLFWMLPMFPDWKITSKIGVLIGLAAAFAVQVWQSWSYQGYWQLLFLLTSFGLMFLLERNSSLRKISSR